MMWKIIDMYMGYKKWKWIVAFIEEDNMIQKVQYISDGGDELLLINGITVCEHKKLYIEDVLSVLDEFGIIEYERNYNVHRTK